MPRKSRKQSSTGIHHIIIKGLNSQILFEEPRDYMKFLDILSYYKEECDFMIFAYCLMSNHVHLIIKLNSTPLENIFKRLNTRYAIWFNMKYNRTGHLLQDRYYSEPVENLAYLNTVIAYVHKNPFKAGLEANPGKSYKWNSIHEYMKDTPYIVDLSYLYQLIPRDNVLDILSNDSEEECLDVSESPRRIPDDVAKDIIHEIASCNNATEFQSLSLSEKSTFIPLIHNRGVSIRQLNRLTGMSIGSIQRCIKQYRAQHTGTVLDTQ